MTQEALSWHGLYDSLGRPLDKMPDKIHPATNTVLNNTGPARSVLQVAYKLHFIL